MTSDNEHQRQQQQQQPIYANAAMGHSSLQPMTFEQFASPPVAPIADPFAYYGTAFSNLQLFKYEHDPKKAINRVDKAQSAIVLLHDTGEEFNRRLQNKMAHGGTPYMDASPNYQPIHGGTPFMDASPIYQPYRYGSSPSQGIDSGRCYVEVPTPFSLVPPNGSQIQSGVVGGGHAPSHVAPGPKHTPLAPNHSTPGPSGPVTPAVTAYKRTTVASRPIAPPRPNPSKRRGRLPASAIAVMQTWFMNHLTWPYPSDEDKKDIADQTHLSLPQVVNWFTNTRKRFWIPNKDQFIDRNGKIASHIKSFEDMQASFLAPAEVSQVFMAHPDHATQVDTGVVSSSSHTGRISG